MRIFTGSCHCGAIRFEIETELNTAIKCNCSICKKKGALHHRVPPERFKLLSGEESLTLYQFDSKEAKHWFCKHCGIQPFSNPRAAPSAYSVNINCLDECETEQDSVEVRSFDGKNWESAIQTFKFE